MSCSPDPAVIGAEVEQLLARLAAVADPAARRQAEELVRLLLSLYGEALTRILSIVRTEGGGPDAVCDRFANDGLIASLLALHDLRAEPLLQITSRRAQAAEPPPAAAAERCELCGGEIASDHAHLVDTHARRLLCACRVCSAIQSGAPAGSRYRAASTRHVRLTTPLADAEWTSLGIPVDLAFLFFNSAAGRMIAFYPSPAGATESVLPLEAWSALAAAHPMIVPAPDVEGLLVRRVNGTRECSLVPIDRCYELVGRIRVGWTGMSGGDVQRDIDRFFDQIAERSGADNVVPAAEQVGP